MGPRLAHVDLVLRVYDLFRDSAPSGDVHGLRLLNDRRVVLRLLKQGRRLRLLEVRVVPRPPHDDWRAVVLVQLVHRLAERLFRLVSRFL